MQRIKREKRIAHEMKPITRIKIPSNLLFFDTETKGKIDKSNPSSCRHTLWFGWSLAFRYEHGVRTRLKWKRFQTASEFWSFVVSRMDNLRPLYCFAYNLGFDLTITDFWRMSEKLPINIDFAVLEDPPLAIRGFIRNKSLYLIDCFNYWKTGVAELAKSVGLQKLPMPKITASQLKWDKYCKGDVEPLAKAITRLLDYLRINDLGGFGISAPGIAMNILKHSFLKRDVVFIHDNLQVLDLERDAYYGGIVQNFYIGKVKERLYNVDVNSLYPAMMLKPMPVKYLGKEVSPTIKQVKSLLKSHGVCAQVLINSKHNVYPTKREGKLLYANGKFITSLCGPELKPALDHNDVEEIVYMSYYELADLFSDYVKFFWNERLKAKKNNDIVTDLFAKLMLNSLYGKFGQRGYQWRELNYANLELYYNLQGLEPPREYRRSDFEPTINWGLSKWFAEGLQHPISIRAFSGQTQLKFPIGEHTESSPIISAYVTSYARQYLLNLIRIAGTNSTYYADTDSLFVNKCGYSRLQRTGNIRERELGKLKLEGSATNSVFNCPKDYVFAGITKIKGIRKDAIQIGDNEYLQNEFEGVKSILQRKPLPYVTIGWVTKQIKRNYNKGIILKNGRVEFITLNEW